MPSDFFTQPAFGGNRADRPSLLAHLSVSMDYRIASAGFTAAPRSGSYYDPDDNVPPGQSRPEHFYSDQNTGGPDAIPDFDDIPWGGSRGSGYASDSTDGGNHQALVDAEAQAQSAVGDAQSALGEARGQLASAQSAVAQANTAFLAASLDLNGAQQEAWNAAHSLKVLTARAAPAPQIQAAHARADAAQIALVAKESTYTQAQTDLGTATGALSDAQGAVASAQSNLASAQAAYTKAEQNLADYDANVESYRTANPDPDKLPVYTRVYKTQGGGTTFAPSTTHVFPATALAGNTFAYAGTQEHPPGGCPTGPYYSGGQSQGQYRAKILIPALAWRCLQNRGAALRLTWNVVSVSHVTKSIPSIPTGQCSPLSVTVIDDQAKDVLSVSKQTETIALAGAVQQDDGSFVVYGQTHTLSALGSGTPSGGPTQVSVVGVAGPAYPPSVTAQVQEVQGTARRQGYPEFQTQPGQSTRRFLRLQASLAPGVSAPYGGTIDLVPVPDNPGPNDIYFGLPSLYADPPLSAHLNLSAGLQDYYFSRDRLPPLPTDSPSAPSDGATVLSATQRLMQDPAGLIWTLSNEQTPGTIAAQAQAKVPDWPPDDAGGASGSAMLFTSDDVVIIRRMRYKLTYVANDSRPSDDTDGFSCRFRWALRRRNLQTGAVSLEEHSREVSFPQEVTGADGKKEKTWRYTDPQWTEVTAAEHERVELVTGTDGENDSPQSFLSFGSKAEFVQAPSGSAGS